MIGLAPQASTAEQLATALGHGATGTVDKLVWELTHRAPQHRPDKVTSMDAWTLADHRRGRAGVAADDNEKAASLALRAGDPLALGFDIDHHRLHVAAPDAVYTAWAADIAGGRQSLMTGPTLERVTQLNARARPTASTHCSSPAAGLAARWPPRPGRPSRLGT